MSELDRITWDVDLPGDGSKVWSYPGGASGRIAKIRGTDDRSWFAAFGGGLTHFDGLWHFAGDDESFLIVHRGAGYHVHCDTPGKYTELPLSPVICTAQFIEARDMLVVFDGTNGAAYTRTGTLWSSPRLFLDEAKIVAFDENTITTSGYAPWEDSKEARVVLDVRDGRILEGKPFDWGEMGFQELVVADTSDAR